MLQWEVVFPLEQMFILFLLNKAAQCLKIPNSGLEGKIYNLDPSSSLVILDNIQKIKQQVLAVVINAFQHKQCQGISEQASNNTFIVQ